MLFSGCSIEYQHNSGLFISKASEKQGKQQAGELIVREYYKPLLSIELLLTEQQYKKILFD
jgi:hypothetical protein